MARLRDMPEVHTFQQAQEFLGKKNRRKYAANTYVERLSDVEIGVLYHATYIVRMFADGCVKLNSGGWFTYSTKERINLFLPAGIGLSQTLGKWYLAFWSLDENGWRERDENGRASDSRTVDFVDGMMFYSRDQIYTDTRQPLPDADVDGDRRAYNRGRRYNGRRVVPEGAHDEVWQRGRASDCSCDQCLGIAQPEPARDFTERDARNIVRERLAYAGIPVNQVIATRERDEAEIARELDRRDQEWRRAQDTRASEDPDGESYVPSFARGNSGLD